RPRPAHATFSGRGVPVELLVDLANRLKADPWFCMPHLADDDFVRQFAAMVKARLDPSLKVYLEYSNESWNSMFGQSGHVARTGRSLGFSSNPFEAGLRYHARRAVQIFRLWRDAFGGTDRLVRTLACQAANPWASRTLLAFEEAGTQADALAVASYVGFA